VNSATRAFPIIRKLLTDALIVERYGVQMEIVRVLWANNNILVLLPPYAKPVRKLAVLAKFNHQLLKRIP